MYYASRRLTAAEWNYCTREREALGLILSIMKFRHYLLARKLTFHVDHTALLYIADKSTLTGKLARWALLLQEFTFDIVHRLGSQHELDDYLSRLEVNATFAIPDDFPNTAILTVITVSTPDDPNVWLQKIELYLLTGMVSHRVEGDAWKKPLLRCR